MAHMSGRLIPGAVTKIRRHRGGIPSWYLANVAVVGVTNNVARGALT